PIATLSATSIDFGAVRAGATVSRTVTLTNTGSTPLHLGVPIVFMETDLTTATDCTWRTLAPGQHCSITETFQPGGGPVRLHATVFLTDDAPSGREEIDVRGTST
ncbi:MAG: choice-of-anchor D domain-containing protein, partial [Acidimicrobiales bacterium]